MSAGRKRSWTPASIVDSAILRVRSQVGDAGVLAGVSGGVDSMVAAALVQRAVGDQLTCVFVDTGLMRQGEPQAVAETVGGHIGARLLAVNAAETFLEALAGVTDPELKRRIVGEKFIRVFEEQSARRPAGAALPGAGDDLSRRGRVRAGRNGARRPASRPITTSPDCLPICPSPWSSPCAIFSRTKSARWALLWDCPRTRSGASRSRARVWRSAAWARSPSDRLERLRRADAIVTEELGRADLLRRATAQAFAVLLPVRSVGVMGDQRTYGETIVLRAVTTDDFMTADWARLPEEVLARVSSRIVNEVDGVNRVLFDITSKPPATIEWE